MRKSILAATALFLILAQSALAGDTFPDFSIRTHLEESDRTYLGLTETERFRLSDIAAEYLLIEVFSMYCPLCQRDAPTVNVWFEEIAAEGNNGKIKLIGIGAGNTPFEVEFFRKKFNVPFPLIPDEDYFMHKALGNVGTPYFVLVKNSGPNNLEIMYAREGAVDNEATMLRDILSKAGIR